jgi:hypothetical protein
MSTGTSIVGGRLRAEMAVYEHQALRRLARQQRIGEANLGKDAPEGVGWSFGMSPPILGIGQQVAARTRTKDLTRSRIFMASRPPLGSPSSIWWLSGNNRPHVGEVFGLRFVPSGVPLFEQ